LDSFNTALAIQSISGLVTQFNSATSVSDATVLLAAQWVTRILTIFGLDETNNLSDSTRVCWSGLNIPSAAKAYIYPASQLRDSIRQSARSGALDYDAIASLADNAKPEEVSSAEAETANPYQAVFAEFRDSVKSLAESKAPSKDLLALCDSVSLSYSYSLLT
jgi:cysteinyl-tRNA synthetase